MAEFQDTNGKSWTLKLTGPLIKQLREQLGLFYPGKESEGYELMAADPALLVDGLWIVCRKQADEAKIGPEQFGEALVGDAIGKATEALLEALVNFSPSPKLRELLRATVETTKDYRETGIDRALGRIRDPALKEKVLKAMDAEMDEVITKALTRPGNATGLPASSDSPPTTTPSAS